MQRLAQKIRRDEMMIIRGKKHPEQALFVFKAVAGNVWPTEHGLHRVDFRRTLITAKKEFDTQGRKLRFSKQKKIGKANICWFG